MKLRPEPLKPPPEVRDPGPLVIEQWPLDRLIPFENNPRDHSPEHEEQIASSMVAYGPIGPILSDEAGNIIAGHGRLAAARLLGLATYPVIVLRGLSEAQKRGLRIADNALAEGSSWDRAKLTLELKALRLEAPKADLTIQTGLTTPQLDLLLGAPAKKADPLDRIPPAPVEPVTRRGDMWILGRHRLLCGDSRRVSLYPRVMGGQRARLMLSDAPFNVPISGHVCGSGKVKHAEFAMASGEMTPAQFTSFLELVFSNAAEVSLDGSIAMLFMDWRHMGEMLSAGHQVYDRLLNLCVWSKDRAGMGSFYRSQHELIFVWKLGEAAHINNIELGKHGRHRTNVWNARAAITTGRNSELAWHPTCKPVCLLMDAIMDASLHGEAVLDPFGGSGSTLIACEKVGREARLIEFEPKYCDVTVARWEELTSEAARLEETGETLAQVKTRRLCAGADEEAR